MSVNRDGSTVEFSCDWCSSGYMSGDVFEDLAAEGKADGWQFRRPPNYEHWTHKCPLCVEESETMLDRFVL